MWTCPDCRERIAPQYLRCSRCGHIRDETDTLAPLEAPLRKLCPSCGEDVQDPPQEGRLHCRKCGHDFGDYEDWVRQCRIQAYAAYRPPPRRPEDLLPPPLPPRIRAVAAGLILFAPIYALSGLLSPILLPACIALAALQAVAGLLLLKPLPFSDRFARLAVGLSALAAPIFPLAIGYAVLFGYLVGPPVTRYFGVRVKPAPAGIRQTLVAWLLVLSALLMLLFLFAVPAALEIGAPFDEPYSPLVSAGADVSEYLIHNWWGAPFGILSAILAMSMWGRINRAAFLTAAPLALVLLAVLASPTLFGPLHYGIAANRARTLMASRQSARLLNSLGDPDPKMRIAAARALEAARPDPGVAGPALLRALDDSDPRVRLNVAIALATLDPQGEKAIPVLVRFLEEGRLKPEDADRATRALGYFGPAAREALAVLLERIKASGAAVEALAEIGPAAAPGVTEFLKHADPAVRGRAAQALRLLGSSARNAVPTLEVAVLEEPDPAVRAETIAALAEIEAEKAISQLLLLLDDDPNASGAAGAALCGLGMREGLPKIRAGGSSLNALRRPTLWHHLKSTILDGDVEGTGREVVQRLADRAIIGVELPPESAAPAPLQEFRRIHSRPRKRSILEALKSLDVEFILESDRIRIVTEAQAREFWALWLKNRTANSE